MNETSKPLYDELPRPYYILLAIEGNEWVMQFGDYERSVVVDQKQDEFFGIKTLIRKSLDDQDSIDETVLAATRALQKKRSAEKAIVHSKNGVGYDVRDLPDLWHIAQSLPKTQRAAVLDVWHKAHAMRDALGIDGRPITIK